MKFFYIFFLLFVFLLSNSKLMANKTSFKSCANLVKALDLNTGAYNKCLFAKPNEKYTSEDLKACQRHYLNEIERLSYVYKNICK